jgi:purine-cytosine permease-like protein
MQKLFSGKCSLWFTLWIGYGLPFYIFLMLVDLFSSKHKYNIMAYITALGALCYCSAMTIAVWKSSDLYNGPEIWKLAAKVLVVFFDIQLLAELSKFF